MMLRNGLTLYRKMMNQSPTAVSHQFTLRMMYVYRLCGKCLEEEKWDYFPTSSSILGKNQVSNPASGRNAQMR